MQEQILNLEEKVSNLEKMKNDSCDTVIAEIEDREYRSSNLMVYNLQESNSTIVEDRKKFDSDHIKSIVEEVTGGIDATEAVVNVFRVGKAVPGRNRSVKVVLSSSSSRLVKEIIKILHTPKLI
ncbi:hypothetical protein HHI36_005646 [Cryptolaemus montrouzieri]|uniref:Uncharacterized protein n=1 Tax=Cryptolaemus montrouzieri TaxID=559131 RepID=A0ABD2NVM2_9CUCU